mmetsp:Transcript_87479/g.225340  ORF Transcript_87479/g.225340 Transcript_87479/m.225340 type:complete len:200 (+) Transcript_87479:489-1088(+)
MPVASSLYSFSTMSGTYSATLSSSSERDCSGDSGSMSRGAECSVACGATLGAATEAALDSGRASFISASFSSTSIGTGSDVGGAGSARPLSTTIRLSVAESSSSSRGSVLSSCSRLAGGATSGTLRWISDCSGSPPGRVATLAVCVDNGLFSTFPVWRAPVVLVISRSGTPARPGRVPTPCGCAPKRPPRRLFACTPFA